MLERELSFDDKRRYVSPVLYGLHEALSRKMSTCIRGTVLDAGCGYAPFRRLLEQFSDRYESLDQKQFLNDQTHMADIQSMDAIPSGRYDAILCSEVLEHLPRPEAALREVHRLLKSDGVLILTVPYLSRLHDEPHDYYRYTRHGLRYLLESHGFRGIEIERTGSYFSFLGHQVATCLIGTTWHLPGIRWISVVLVAGLVTLPSRLADRLLGSERLPLGYIAIARRHTELPLHDYPHAPRVPSSEPHRGHS